MEEEAKRVLSNALTSSAFEVVNDETTRDQKSILPISREGNGNSNSSNSESTENYREVQKYECSRCEMVEKKLQKSKEWHTFFLEKLSSTDKLYSDCERERRRNVELQLAYDDQQREWKYQHEQLTNLLHEVLPLREKLRITEGIAMEEKKKREELEVKQESLLKILNQHEAQNEFLLKKSNHNLTEKLEKKLKVARSEIKKHKAIVDSQSCEISDLKQYQEERHIHNERTNKKAYWGLSLAIEYGNRLQSIDENWLDGDENAKKEWERLVTLHSESKNYMWSLYDGYRKNMSKKLKNDLVAIASLPKRPEWLNDFDKRDEKGTNKNKTPEKGSKPKQLKSYAEELEMILSFEVEDKEETIEGAEGGIKGKNAKRSESKEQCKKKEKNWTHGDNESESSSEDEELKNSRSEKRTSISNRNNNTNQQSLKYDRKRSILSSDDDDDDDDDDLEISSRRTSVKNSVGKQQQSSIETGHEKSYKTDMKEGQSKEQHLSSAKELNPEKLDGRRKLKGLRRGQKLIDNVSGVEKGSLKTEESNTHVNWKCDNFESLSTTQGNTEGQSEQMNEYEAVLGEKNVFSIDYPRGSPTTEEDSNCEGNDDLLFAIMREMAVPALMDGFESGDSKPEHEPSFSPEQRKPRNVEDDLALSSDDESDDLPSLHPRALTTQQSQEFRISDSVEEKMDERDEAMYCKTPLVLTQQSEGFSVEEIDDRENDKHDKLSVAVGKECHNLKRTDTQSSIGFDTKSLINKECDVWILPETSVQNTESSDIRTENSILVEDDARKDQFCDEVEREKDDRNTTVSEDSFQDHTASADEYTENSEPIFENAQVNLSVDSDIEASSVSDENMDMDGKMDENRSGKEVESCNQNELENGLKTSAQNTDIQCYPKIDINDSCVRTDKEKRMHIQEHRVQMEECQTDNKSKISIISKCGVKGLTKEENREGNDDTHTEELQESGTEELEIGKVCLSEGEEIHMQATCEERHKGDKNENIEVMKNTDKEEEIEGNQVENIEVMEGMEMAATPEKTAQVAQCPFEFSPPVAPSSFLMKKGKPLKRTQHFSESKEIKSFSDNVENKKNRSVFSSSETGSTGNESEEDNFSVLEMKSKNSIDANQIIKTAQQNGTTNEFQKQTSLDSEHTGSEEELETSQVTGESQMNGDGRTQLKTLPETLVSLADSDKAVALNSKSDISQMNGDHRTQLKTLPKTNISLAGSDKAVALNSKSDISQCSTIDSKDDRIQEAIAENDSLSEKGSKAPEFTMVTRKRQMSEEAPKVTECSVSSNTRGYLKRRPSLKPPKKSLKSPEETDWRENIDYIGVASEEENSRDSMKRKNTRVTQTKKRRSTANSKLALSKTENTQHRKVKQIFDRQTGEAVGDAEYHEPSSTVLSKSVIFNWGRLKLQPGQQNIKFSKNAVLTKDGAGSYNDAKHTVFSLEKRVAKEPDACTQDNKTTEISQKKGSAGNPKPEIVPVENSTPKTKAGRDEIEEDRTVKYKTKCNENEHNSEKDNGVVNCNSEEQETAIQKGVKSREKLRRGIAAKNDEDHSEVHSSEDSSIQELQNKGRRSHFTKSTRMAWKKKELSDLFGRLSSSSRSRSRSRSSLSSFNLDTSISDEESTTESNNQMLSTKRTQRRSALFSTEESDADSPRAAFKMPSKRKKRKVPKKKLDSRNDGNSGATVSGLGEEKRIKSALVHVKKWIPESKDKDNKDVRTDSVVKNVPADSVVLNGNENVFKANTRNIAKRNASTVRETTIARNRRVKASSLGTRQNTSVAKRTKDTFGVVSQLAMKAMANKELLLKKSPKRGKSVKVIRNRIISESPSSEDSDETNAEERKASKESCKTISASEDSTAKPLDKEIDREDLSISEGSSEKILTDSHDGDKSEKMSVKSLTSDDSTSEGGCRDLSLNGKNLLDDLHSDAFSSANTDEEMVIVAEGSGNSSVPDDIQDQQVKINIKDTGVLDEHGISLDEGHSAKVFGRASAKQSISKDETLVSCAHNNDISDEEMDLVIEMDSTGEEKEASQDKKPEVEKSAKLSKSSVLSKSAGKTDVKEGASRGVERLPGALAQLSRMSKPCTGPRGAPPPQKTKIVNVPASADYIENLFAGMATSSQAATNLPVHDQNKDKQNVPFTSTSLNSLGKFKEPQKSQTILIEPPSRIGNSLQRQRSQTILIQSPSKERNFSPAQRSQTKLVGSFSKKCNFSQPHTSTVHTQSPPKVNQTIRKSRRLSMSAPVKNRLSHSEQTMKPTDVPAFGSDVVETGDCNEDLVTKISLPSGKELSKQIIPGVREEKKESTVPPNSLNSANLLPQKYFPEEEGQDKELPFSEQLEDLINCTVNSPQWTQLIAELCALPTMNRLPQLIRTMLVCIMKVEPVVTHKAGVGLPSGLYKLFQAVKLFELRLALPQAYLDDQILLSIHKFICKSNVNVRPSSLACLVAWYTASCAINQKWEKARVFVFEVLYFYPGVSHQALLSALSTTRNLLLRTVKYRNMSALEEVLHWIVYHGPWMGAQQIRQNLIMMFSKQTGLKKEPDKDPDALATRILSTLVEYEKKERSHNLIASLMLLAKWQGNHWVYKTLVPSIVAIAQEEKWQVEDEDYKGVERDEAFILLLETIFKEYPVQEHLEEISKLVPTSPGLHQSKLLKLVYGNLRKVVEEVK